MGHDQNPRRQENERKHAQRVVISYFDFQQCLEMLDQLSSGGLAEPLRKACEDSAILAYSRPFSGNDSKTPGGVGDLRETALRVLSEAEKRLHARVCHLRNTLVAHSDAKPYRVSFSYWDFGGQDRLLVPHRYTFPQLLSEQDLDVLRGCCHSIRSWLLDELQRLDISGYLGSHK